MSAKSPKRSWREVIETELMGFTRVVAASLPLFRRQGGGNFVAIVSIANYSYPPGDALSAVPKAGIEMLGRAIAKEEGRFEHPRQHGRPWHYRCRAGRLFPQRQLYTPEIWETQRMTRLRCFSQISGV